jgi:hypothetical protein
MASLDPSPDFEAGSIGGIGTREAAGSEAEPLGFRPYCFLKALAPIHPGPVHRPRQFS